ncbi:peptidyl-tRNA hydrolase domain protein [Aspergillus candidus]|uniref:Prokaryotic-type class I peptide chain release factors domain-containing protein n=1 Tax=Aspergillus candidus TaxID=41067 RepID=A0A2I2FJP7_ASPCN|nr:hypothetical protein BDW47DRAFT_123380 [Aspergillus candidus]PLB40851.1 hypothetical protein BDW47DRAFT_123380 [Aspergillus candidus]
MILPPGRILLTTRCSPPSWLPHPLPTTPLRPFASRRTASLPNTTTPPSDDDVTEARRWLSTFDSKSIPRHLCEISFSRSGGPGGQNVNKVNSKATLKISLHGLLPLLPPLLHGPLRSSRYFAERSESLVIQSQESRKQTSNVDACYDKLYQLLRTTADDAIPGETSQAQKDRVAKLKKAENETRLKTKKFLSSKKASRRGRSDE